MYFLTAGCGFISGDFHYIRRTGLRILMVAFFVLVSFEIQLGVLPSYHEIDMENTNIKKTCHIVPIR